MRNKTRTVAVQIPRDTRYRAGHQQVRDSAIVKIDIDIDWPRLAQLLGERAVHNRSKKAGLLGGRIKAKAVGAVPAWLNLED